MPTYDVLYFFFNETATTEIYTLSLHDALPISDHRRTPRSSDDRRGRRVHAEPHSRWQARGDRRRPHRQCRSEEHTSELQSQSNLVCRLLLEKKIIQVHHYIQLDDSIRLRHTIV